MSCNFKSHFYSSLQVYFWNSHTILSTDYVNDIYSTLINTPRAQLKELEQELAASIPDPLHSMHEKEDKDDAIKKHKERKEKETPICPPTCSGNLSMDDHNIIVITKLLNTTIHMTFR